MSLATNSNGEVIVEGSRLFVSPAAGDIFSVSVTDDNGTKRMSNGFVETGRLLHYMEVKMDNPNFFNNVDVDVRGLPRKVGGIEMRAHIVERMRGGLSLHNSNINPALPTLASNMDWGAFFTQ